MPMLMTFLMGLPVWPFHSPLRIAIGEGSHLVQHGMHVGHDILAVDFNLRSSRSAQSDMQHRAFLGDVDLLAAKHGIATSLPRRARAPAAPAGAWSHR